MDGRHLIAWGLLALLVAAGAALTVWLAWHSRARTNARRRRSEHHAWQRGRDADAAAAPEKR